MRLVDADELKSHIAYIAYQRFKATADNSDTWAKFTEKEIEGLIDNAPTVADRYDEGFRDGYAQCINDKEERKENNRLFQKGGAEE